MMKEMIIWFLSVGVFLLYMKSSSQKLRNPYALQLVAEGYQMVSPRVVKFVAPLIAVLELLSAIWIIIPHTREIGALTGALLQILFMFMIFKNLGRTMPYGCGCFELNQPKKVSVKHFWFNFALFSVMVSVVVLS